MLRVGMHVETLRVGWVWDAERLICITTQERGNERGCERLHKYYSGQVVKSDILTDAALAADLIFAG